MERPKQAICDCGSSYYGNEHYYEKRYCDNCGKWLHWDRHSNIDQEYTQSEMDLRREERNG